METVFIGTYTTEPGTTVPTASGGVYAAAFDPSSGALGVAKVAAALQSPTVRFAAPRSMNSLRVELYREVLEWLRSV